MQLLNLQVLALGVALSSDLKKCGLSVPWHRDGTPFFELIPTAQKLLPQLLRLSHLGDFMGRGSWMPAGL